MAVGGMMGKGHINGGGRGRPYGMMLLLAFGAAVFGVMLLHRLRERRVFSILVKEKDRDILTLQLLLQREKDSTKDTFKSIKEMKRKLYTLQNQNVELERRILEVQSTVSSLNDERRVMESALEEKRIEIEMLREKEASKEDHQSAALMDTVKQKEAEIGILKDLLKHPLNSTTAGALGVENKHDGSTIQGDQGHSGGEAVANEFVNPKAENLTGGEDGVHKQRKEMTGEGYSQRMKRPQEDFNQGSKNDDPQGVMGSGETEEKTIAYATEAIHNDVNGVSSIHIDIGDMKGREDSEHETTTTGKQEMRVTSEGGDSQEVGKKSKGGMKSQVSDGSKSNVIPRIKGKNVHGSKAKGRRSRILANERSKSNDGFDSPGATSIRFHSVRNADLSQGALSVAEPNEMRRHSIDDTDMRLGHDSDQANMELEKRIDDRMEYPVNTSIHDEASQAGYQPKPEESRRPGTLEGTSDHQFDRTNITEADDNDKLETEEGNGSNISSMRRSRGQEVGGIQLIGRVDADNKTKEEGTITMDDEEEAQDLITENLQEQDADTDFFQQSVPKLKADKDEYNEEITEPEF